MPNASQTSRGIRRWTRLPLAVGSFVSIVVGCAIDERELQGVARSVATGGAASGGASESGGGASAGTPADFSSAGAAGAAGDRAASNGLVDGCADLDRNGVSDCTETLVHNADFKINVDGWTSEAGVSSSWAAANALGDRPSGSDLIAAVGASDEPGFALLAASQCVAMSKGQVVIANVDVTIGSDQPATGQAAIYVFFFDQPDCAGSPSGSMNATSAGQTRGAWFQLGEVGMSGPGTRSALVKLAMLKPFAARAFNVAFDNVLVTAHAP